VIQRDGEIAAAGDGITRCLFARELRGSCTVSDKN
jgi:hypothetical protein